MDKVLSYMTSIALLVAIITGTIVTLIVCIDAHKHNKLIQEMYRSKK